MSQRGCAATSAGCGGLLGEDDSFKSTSELLRDSFKRHYSNLIGGWNGLFRSPQMRSYASFWWNWDGGWLHRWGDQQFWSHALYVTNATRMSRVRHDGVVVGGDVISLEHHRQHREFVHTGG